MWDMGSMLSAVVARSSPRLDDLIGRGNPYLAKDYGFFNAKSME